MRLVLLQRRSPRAPLAVTTVSLILAGVFAGRYAMEPGHIWSLAMYVVCLSASVTVMARLDLVSSRRPQPNATSTNERQLVGHLNSETEGPSSVAEKSTRPKTQSKAKPTSMVQQSLDLDGMGALRSLEQITGQWLVCDASEPAAKLIRSVCLERIRGDESDQERAERWFEIAHGLRSRECRSLPKAELRRSFVADKVGVSKEQVRQIDQGRYAPLNKLLDELDPKSF